MTFSEAAIRANRDYFAAKLGAEKQKADVVKKAKERQGDFLVLDTRTREAFEQGHIEGAWCLPLAEIETLTPELPRNKELVTYCWNHT